MPLSGQPAPGRLDLSASAGASRSADFTVSTAAGLPVTGWTGAAAPTVQVWPGDDREALAGAGLSATWKDAANGVVLVTSAGTHTISPGVYQWRMLATFDGTTYEICRGNYTIAAAPGDTDNATDNATSPYTTIDDLRTLAPWIEQNQGKHDRQGFAEHQEAARAWFDDVVLSAWRNASGRLTEYPFSIKFNDAVDYPPQWLRDVLATGSGVKMTPRIKRACAAYACYSICAAQAGIDETASQYRKHAVRFRAMAHSEVVSMVVFVKSSTAATTWDIAINLGVAARN